MATPTPCGPRPPGAASSCGPESAAPTFTGPTPAVTYTARGVFAEGRLDSASSSASRFSGGGVWEFRPLDGPPAAGRIARIVDRNGNALRFGYDETGRLAVVTDTLGRDIRVGYDRAGRLATLTDFTGRRVSYSYTAHGDLASVTYPAVTGTPTGNDFPDGATIRVHLLRAAPAGRHHRPGRGTVAGHRVRRVVRPRAGELAALGAVRQPGAHHLPPDRRGDRSRDRQRRQR